MSDMFNPSILMLVHKTILKNIVATNESFKLFVDAIDMEQKLKVWIKFESGVYTDFSYSYSDIDKWMFSEIGRLNSKEIKEKKEYDILANLLIKPLNKWIISNGRSL